MSDRIDRAEIQKILDEHPQFQALYDKWKVADRSALKSALNDMHGLDGEDDPKRKFIYPKSASRTSLLYRIMERLKLEERWKTSSR
jgi:hypothetical protein